MPVALIVDDNPFFLRVETLILERHGFEVLTAEDGEEGYAVFHDHMPRIDIVITDLLMPNLSGSELCKRIKNQRPDTGLKTSGKPSCCMRLVLKPFS